MYLVDDIHMLVASVDVAISSYIILCLIYYDFLNVWYMRIKCIKVWYLSNVPYNLYRTARTRQV